MWYPRDIFKGERLIVMGDCMLIEGEFGVLHQRVVEILGGSLLEVIATGEAISADAIAGMIRVLHHDELDDLAVKLAIDVLLQDM